MSWGEQLSDRQAHQSSSSMLSPDRGPSGRRDRGSRAPVRLERRRDPQFGDVSGSTDWRRGAAGSGGSTVPDADRRDCTGTVSANPWFGGASAVSYRWGHRDDMARYFNRREHSRRLVSLAVGSELRPGGRDSPLNGVHSASAIRWSICSSIAAISAAWPGNPEKILASSEKSVGDSRRFSTSPHAGAPSTVARTACGPCGKPSGNFNVN